MINGLIKSTAKVLQQMEACAEKQIQIAVFPEGCLFGYCCDADYWEQISPQVFKEAGFFGDEIVSATIDLSQSAGSQAKRTYNEDTILQEWFRKGCEFVEKV